MEEHEEDGAKPARPRARKGTGAVTLKDVARAAGVGTTTVSRVIRNIGPVTEATRSAVQEAIRRLGYAPNLVAGSLASLDSGLIGVVIPSTRVLLFLDLISGIQAGLKGTRYRAVIAETGYDAEAEEEAIRTLLGWRPAAMLVAGLEHTPAARDLLRTYRGRVIELTDLDGDPVDAAVGYSTRESGRLTAEFIIGRGYRRPAYVGHRFETDTRNGKRFAEMERRLAADGIAFVGTLLSSENATVSLGRSATAQILKDHPETDVLVYANDTLAMGGVFHCMAAGLRMPEDLAIFGFSAVDIAQELPQALSTVDTRRYEIGLRAVREAIENPDRPDRPRKVDTGLAIIAGQTA